MTDSLNVNPKMIKWARENAGYALNQLPETLKDAEKWENGEKTPSWEDLRNLAKKYKRPSFFFFLKEAPQDEEGFIDFRFDEKMGKFTPQLRLEIINAKHRRNDYIQLLDDIGIPMPNFSNYVIYEKDFKKLSAHIRNYLGIDSLMQKNQISNMNQLHYFFLNHLKKVCFDLGVLVLEITGVDESEFMGCSIYYDICPIILINGENHYNCRIFTLIHELVHLTQGHSAICNMNKYNAKEVFCNKVASELLMSMGILKNRY